MHDIMSLSLKLCERQCAQYVKFAIDQCSHLPRVYLVLKGMRNFFRRGKGWKEIRRLEKRGEILRPNRPIRFEEVKYDLPARTKTRKNVLVCSSPRSGSTLLCNLLAGTNVVGQPTEYFNLPLVQGFFQHRFQASDTRDYILQLQQLRTSPNGVFACKLHYFQYVQMFGDRALQDYFANVKYIYLYRKDTVAQAVSWAKAILSGEYSTVCAEGKELPYEEAAIRRCYLDIYWENNGWKCYFDRWSIRPLVLQYEQVAEDFGAALDKVLSFLEVEKPANFAIPDPGIRKMANHMNQDWTDRIRAKLPKWPTKLNMGERIAGPM